MIVLARTLDADRRALRKLHDDTSRRAERHSHELLAQGMFAATAQRLSRRDLHAAPVVRHGQGLHRGRQEGPADHDDRRALRALDEAAGKAPFDLPPRWVDKKAKLNAKTPFNFVVDERHHRRQLGLAGGQPRRARSSGSSSTATSSRSSATSSTTRRRTAR